MPILDRQRRTMELGRIRTGQVEKRGSKTFPSKLDRFRITSPSDPLLAGVAALYGGDVRQWTPLNGGPPQFEVITNVDRLPVLIPPQPVTQWLEAWSGGGCQRRCDGETEHISKAPCVCDPENRECKPTTRLNVMLRDVAGVGLWRLESHGWNAAIELPELAEFLANARGYLPADLVLQQRMVRKADERHPRQFAVPVLEVTGVTPGQLMAGYSAPSTPELAAAQSRAIEGAPEGWEQLEEDAPVRAASAPQSVPAVEPVPDAGPDWESRVQGCSSVDDTRAVWADAQASGALTPELRRALTDKATSFNLSSWDAPSPQQTPAAPVVDDLDSIWLAILRAVPEDWTTTRVEKNFREVIGKAVDKADAVEMRRYLTRFEE